MDRLNNVNLEAVQTFAAQVQKDAGVGKKLKTVTGRWVFEQGRPQFTAQLEHAGGQQTAEVLRGRR